MIPSRIREVQPRGLCPRRLVQHLALQKASAVHRVIQHKKIPTPARGILAADTLVFLKHHILGQPASVESAKRMLRKLSGSSHEVWTGLALIRLADGRVFQDAARSVVRFRRLSPDEINHYAGKHRDKAGCYAIQERRDPVADVVRGEYSNVVGLPVRTLRKLLKRV